MAFFARIKDYFALRRARRIERAGKLIKNAKAIREDRWAALEYLAKDLKDAGAAIPLLLQRFEYSLEHGINDTREKELAQEGVVRFGDEAIPFLRDWLQQTSRIAWPIKCLKALGKDEIVIECLKAALNFKDVSFSQHDVDKNYDILCYLREYQVVDSIDQIAHFLNDADERVRFAAAELLIEQKTDLIKDKISVFLKDASSENRRLRQAVIQVFVDRAWQVSNPQDFAEGWIADGVRLNAKGQIELRT
ncbi:MAG: hypothetical protein NTX25_09060 [Proteobacteria bacterium]|nr:hypothetical protein [Pseudomonadota bacterium]